MTIEDRRNKCFSEGPDYRTFFEEEKKAASMGGYGFGWTNCDEREIQIAHAVAASATKAGLGEYTVQDIFLRTPDKPSGIKVVDKKHKELSGFWDLTRDVKENLGKGNTPVGRRKLGRALEKTIEDKKSGALDRKLAERNREHARFYEDLY